LSVNRRHNQIDNALLSDRGKGEEPEFQALDRFLKNLKQFAFYDDLKAVMSRDGLDVDDLAASGQYKDILEYVLTSRGLDYADLPKGLIAFHRYPGHSRTPFEEHVVEGAAYTRDATGMARLHFTVSPEHEAPIRVHLDEVKDRYETGDLSLDLALSVQQPSTDTIAVDMKNRPFRDESGGLVFRPGGHGALLGNLNSLKGDVVFIKNIDNVVPDRLKGPTYQYKRALGGYLAELQEQVFALNGRLAARSVDKGAVSRALELAREKLAIDFPPGMAKGTVREQAAFLFSRLNKPLRVCGMVKNEGEPGGGPFWVEMKDGSAALQIVESAQVDLESPEQRAVWESSTHFNPVDLVCGVRDYEGKPFDLFTYSDPETGLISVKSQGGNELKALELPGLWNGAMAHWNTVFVEVPIITFNPVKVINDLLRKEHQ
jgi:hypothetical protein